MSGPHYTPSFREVQETCLHEGIYPPLSLADTLFGVAINVWRAEMRLAGARDAMLRLDDNRVIPIVERKSRIPAVARSNSLRIKRSDVN